MFLTSKLVNSHISHLLCQLRHSLILFTGAGILLFGCDISLFLILALFLLILLNSYFVLLTLLNFPSIIQKIPLCQRLDILTVISENLQFGNKIAFKHTGKNVLVFNDLVFQNVVLRRKLIFIVIVANHYLG